MANGIGEKRLAEMPDNLDVEIHNPKTDERLGVTVQGFRDYYQDQGFQIEKRADGLPLLDGNEVNLTPTVIPVTQVESNIPAQVQDTGENQDAEGYS